MSVSTSPLPASDRLGLLAAGNFIVDYVKIIDYYPHEEMLASILRQTPANGGGPYNILKDFAKLQQGLPLAAAGLIGNDATGSWILDDLAADQIDTSQLHRTNLASTSYTDAFTVESSGRRTFFHQRGANALLSPEHFNFSSTSARLFYLGYFMLLDRLDAIGPDGRSGASRVLQAASDAGLITAADVVSCEHPDFARSALSALPWVDHFILNEIEAGKITGSNLRLPDGAIDWSAAEAATQSLLNAGVRRSVVIHFVEGAVAAAPDGSSPRAASLLLPDGWIKGATGAGDAFAAGWLLGLHENLPHPRCLDFAICAAAASLADPTTTGTVLPIHSRA
jgi:sugar/nucleoside kinase (ribokinase family)